MEDRAASTARTIWTLFEPVHAVAYFAPEALAAYEDAGLRGFWRGYFACRAAPLGPVGPEPVAAAFFSFAPAMVARALPDAWQLTAPERALEIRRAGTVAALRRLLTGLEREAERAAEALVPRAAGLDTSGRVLAAAHASLDFPDQPLDRLWHAATLLREHRGDGHVAALVAAGLDGCEALALRAGTDVPRTELQPYRGWTDQEWEEARLHLTERDLLLPDGTASRDGRELLRAVESATDRAAERPWRALTPDAVQDLTTLLTPVSRACATALRFPNPIGVPEPGGG